MPRPTQLLGGLNLTLAPVTGLHNWVHLQSAPPAIHPHTPGPAPITGLHCHVHTLGETVQPQEECTPITRIPTATCGPRSSSVSCHGPTSLGSPAACPSSCEPTCPWPTSQHWAPYLCLWQEPVATALHTDSQDPITASVHSWLQPLLFALAPTTTCVSITGPCHYIWSWPCSKNCAHQQLQPTMLPTLVPTCWTGRYY